MQKNLDLDQPYNVRTFLCRHSAGKTEDMRCRVEAHCCGMWIINEAACTIRQPIRDGESPFNNGHIVTWAHGGFVASEWFDLLELPRHPRAVEWMMRRGPETQL
jgi:hypothetical protein